jgi:hypothetical protein
MHYSSRGTSSVDHIDFEACVIALAQAWLRNMDRDGDVDKDKDEYLLYVYTCMCMVYVWSVYALCAHAA